MGDNGNVYQIWNNRYPTTRNDSFTYDSLNRISSGQSNGSQWGEAFTIDAWGNMTAIGSYNGKPHESLSTSANANNQLVAFGYDAAGNMTSNGSASYVYDAENRLIAAGGYSYIYDGDGQRVEKCTQGTTPGTCASGATGTLYWRGTSSDPLSETDLAGTVQNNYVFFNGQRVARRDSAGLIHYYFSDHLGTHGVVENQTASACEQDIDYYPYGGVQNDYCALVPQHYKLTGKERDTESNLDYFGFRHHASALGRFMTPDPAGIFVADASSPQSWNLYAYVLNSPLSNIDPLGLECVWDDGSFDAADDPKTGSAKGCSGEGGTWVEPYLFESAMLTNGEWNSNYGDWSSSANSYLAQNWVIPSGFAFGDSSPVYAPLSFVSATLQTGPTLTVSAYNPNWLQRVGDTLEGWMNKHSKAIGVAGCLTAPPGAMQEIENGHKEVFGPSPAAPRDNSEGGEGGGGTAIWVYNTNTQRNGGQSPSGSVTGAASANAAAVGADYVNSALPCIQKQN